MDGNGAAAAWDLGWPRSSPSGPVGVAVAVARRHRTEGRRCPLGRLGSVMPGAAGPRSAGCRSRRRAKLGPSKPPRFAGCSRSPGSHSDAGAPVGLPQTSQGWAHQGTYTTPHRRRALVVLRTSTWEMGALAMYIPREMVRVRFCDVSKTSSTAQLISDMQMLPSTVLHKWLLEARWPRVGESGVACSRSRCQ